MHSVDVADRRYGLHSGHGRSQDSFLIGLNDMVGILCIDDMDDMHDIADIDGMAWMTSMTWMTCMAGTAYLSLSCGFECSNHVGARCADIHNLDPWSAADVVTVSRTRYIA